MKIILMANWGLGLEVLKSLHRMPDADLKLVITQYLEGSDDPWFNSVHDFAVGKGYPTAIQNSLCFEDLRRMIVALGIDLLVCHAYMRILPRDVFSAPLHGSINIHPSLLPKYRGAAPTEWVLRNGDKVTGLTCHYIDDGIDTGDIIHQLEVPVETGDDIGALIEKQKLIVGPLLSESLSRIMDPNFRPTRQKSQLAGNAPKSASRGKR
jgi:methionyl-tRNA formyltransferase